MKSYKGYAYHQTDMTTDVKYQRSGRWISRAMRLYAIEGLKEAGKRPFLTSDRACRDYIDGIASGTPPARGEVPQRIQSARASRGMTQQAVGEAVGLSGETARVTVGRWEAGTRPVPREHIRILSKLLGLDPLDLLP